VNTLVLNKARKTQIRHDLAVIRVFYEGRFICNAVCSEFAGVHVGLKDVIQARRAQRKRVRQAIKDRLLAVEALQKAEQPESSLPDKSHPVSKLKRYYNE
jgi:putative transposase